MLLGWRGVSRKGVPDTLLWGSNLCQNAVVCHTHCAILLALPGNLSCSQAKEEWKCYLQAINSQHITSLLWKVSNSKPHGQNRWWMKVPSDSTSFSVPKAFAQFASPILTLTAVILPISQFDVSSGQTGKSAVLWKNLRWQSWKSESHIQLGKIGQGKYKRWNATVSLGSVIDLHKQKEWFVLSPTSRLLSAVLDTDWPPEAQD